MDMELEGEVFYHIFFVTNILLLQFVTDRPWKASGDGYKADAKPCWEISPSRRRQWSQLQKLRQSHEASMCEDFLFFCLTYILFVFFFFEKDQNINVIPRFLFPANTSIYLFISNEIDISNW